MWSAGKSGHVCVCVWETDLNWCILVTIDELCKVLRAQEKQGALQILILLYSEKQLLVYCHLLPTKNFQAYPTYNNFISHFHNH